jgi:hypothetical protein
MQIASIDHSAELDLELVLFDFDLFNTESSYFTNESFDIHSKEGNCSPSDSPPNDLLEWDIWPSSTEQEHSLISEEIPGHSNVQFGTGELEENSPLEFENEQLELNMAELSVQEPLRREIQQDPRCVEIVFALFPPISR